MKFAIDLESNLAEYYQNTNLIENHQAHKGEFSNRAKASINRRKNLERSRRENVTEITLEPIEGLFSDEYELDLEGFTLENVNKNEELAVNFYTDAGPKINVLETRRVFKRCLKEHSQLNQL